MCWTLLPLIVLTAAGLLASLCIKKKPNTAQSAHSASSSRCIRDTPARSQKQETADGKEEKEKDGPIVLDTSLPAVDFLLHHSDEKINDEWLSSLSILECKTFTYIWAMQKRFDADMNSWKELGKKITKLHSEGFFVRAGSEEAKQMRRSGEVENRIATEITRLKTASKHIKSKMK